MLNNFIKFSLNNKYLVILASVVLIVTGTRVAMQMDVDVFPDLTAPTVVVMTDAHGMAAEEVERLVTFPIETATNGATDVRRVRSVSSQGFSFVWVEFDWGTNIYRARQIVAEKIQTVAAQMPLGVSQPVLAPQTSIMGEIFLIGIQADSTDMMELRTIADWEVKPLLLSTEGVSQVTIIGGDYKQYQVLADPYKMQHYKVSLDELLQTCRFVSSNSGGGVLREYGNEYVVKGIARTSNAREIAATMIKNNNGMPVTIGDVAEVLIAPAVKMGEGSQNGSPAIILAVSKQPYVNTLKLTRRVEENLALLASTLPPDLRINTRIFRQADFIETAVNNVKNALIEGAVFVVIILFLFLGSFRTTIISLLAIPISLLGAVLALHALGMNINTMSLGGMAIAIGSLVDDAIIDVENVYKRLRQNRLKAPSERTSSFTVVFEASKEIRASILNATLIIMVAFLPLFFLSGMEGRMLQPLGIAFIVSLFVSLIVAMSLTPVLAKMMLTEKYLARNEKEKWLSRKLSAAYQTSLIYTLNHKKLLLTVVGLLFVVSLLLFARMGRSFLPEFNEGSLTLTVITQPGASLDESNRLGSLIETELLSIEEVITTARRTGRGELDEHSQPVNIAEIDVNFELKNRSREVFMDEVREKLAGVPGIAATVGQPLGHRIDHMLSGTRANIAIKVFGPELGKLFTIGNQIKKAVEDIPGLVDLNVEQQVDVPQLQIRANREMMSAYGVGNEQFHDFVTHALAGEKLSDIYEGQRRFDLIVRYNSQFTQTADGIRSALIDTERGNKIPLENVADIVSVTGPASISRENVQRKVVVSANVSGADLSKTIQSIDENIKAHLKLPEGYRIEYGGQFESEEAASRTLLITSLIALFVIFLLLFQEFRNMKLAGIIMLNLPLALVGGVFTIYFTAGQLSIPAIIGFITLFGIATRNGILLVSKYQQLHERGFALQETILRGSVDRLNPILMTALTAALALIPLAMRGDLSGNEIQSPMAKVILGGLLTSTLLNIYIIPIVYSLLSKRGIIKSDTYEN